MSMPFPPVCLAIGASDCSGGSGIQADLKTFTALACYGASVVTAVTAQNFSSSLGLHVVPDQMIRAQLDAIIAELPVSSVKVGLCPSAGAMRLVARWLKDHPTLPVVVDPVATDASGIALLQPEVVQVLRRDLLPRAIVVTPNRFEAALLADMEECLSQEDMEHAAREILRRHGCPVLVTGGGFNGRSLDVLVGLDGVRHFDSPAIARKKVHGAGCAHSAAIAAGLAKGDSLREAIGNAKAYVSAAYAAAPMLNNGRGALWHGVTVNDQSLTPSV